jgi:hypothetical protein
MFYECKSLTNIEIPNNVTSIGETAFAYCTNLTNIEIPNSVTSIDYMAFYECTSLTSIIIPNSVTSVEQSTFYNCTNLTNVELGDSIMYIGNYAFNYCSLMSITIKTVTPPTFGAKPFYKSCQLDAVIYVPAESVEAYKTAEGWSEFANRIQAIPTI